MATVRLPSGKCWLHLRKEKTVTRNSLTLLFYETVTCWHSACNSLSDRLNVRWEEKSVDQGFRRNEVKIIRILGKTGDGMQCMKPPCRKTTGDPSRLTFTGWGIRPPCDICSEESRFIFVLCVLSYCESFRPWSCCEWDHRCSLVRFCSHFPTYHGLIWLHRCVRQEPEGTIGEPWLAYFF